jgi:copper chaperone CopZ
MENIYLVEGMTCNGCKASVEKSFLALDKVTDVKIDLATKETVITSQQKISLQELEGVLPDKYKISEKKLNPIINVRGDEKSPVQQLFPLFLIFGYILVTSIILNRKDWNVGSFMFDFMGLFYIVFSFFKFLDIRGFAKSFTMYDPLAKTVHGYGLVYPFLELALGLFFLFRYQTTIALLLTLVILGITTVGVTKSLLDKKTIKCACLGAVLNLPMTKATFIENSIMILMALYMLIALF